jgi:hypothetical protein
MYHKGMPSVSLFIGRKLRQRNGTGEMLTEWWDNTAEQYMLCELYTECMLLFPIDIFFVFALPGQNAKTLHFFPFHHTNEHSATNMGMNWASNF